MLGHKPVGTSLSIGFDNLLEAEFLQVTAHYAAAKGSYETFALPPSIFAGIANYASLTPAAFVWRYSSAPSVEWVAPGIGNVSVSFVAVPS